MSYFGELEAAMDFGYTEYPSDVEACCLEYPHPSYFWNGVIHYSTRDCLYETGGYYQDHYGDWNDQEPGLVGTTRAVNLEAIGENVTVESFYTFSCLGEDADELYYNGQCGEGCSFCTMNYTGDQVGVTGCTVVDGTNGPASYKYACVNGSAVMEYYADAKCAVLAEEVNKDSCMTASEFNPPDDLWAGGYMRDSSLIVVVGAMSIELGVSALHDIYLPVYANYNDADAELDFKESDLAGSSAPWVPANASQEELALYENAFVAQWARPGGCLTEGEAGAANGDAAKASPTDFCYEIEESSAPSPFIYNLIVRHYLDPATGTGPHRGALPRHRFMVLDKIAGR